MQSALTNVRGNRHCLTYYDKMQRSLGAVLYLCHKSEGPVKHSRHRSVIDGLIAGAWPSMTQVLHSWSN